MTDTSAPFRFRHDLDDALLEPESVTSLIESRPDAIAEVLKGDVPMLAPHRTPVDLAPSTVSRQIIDGTATHLLRVSRPEADARYAKILDDAIAPHLAPLIDREGFVASGNRVFFAGPHTVTGAHIDRMHGFLLQVRGTKRLTLARVPDDDEHEVELDRACATGEVLPARPLAVIAEFDLGPGDGLFLPACTFHAALVGDETSVAVSALLRTRVTDRMLAVRTCNHHLRRLRLSPRPTGGRFDGAKVLAVRTRFKIAGRSQLSRV